MKMVVLCLMNTVLMATGQMLFKYGSRGTEISGIMNIFRLFFTPTIFCALCLYAVSTGLWLYILSRVSINFAYPIQSLSLPLVLIASHFLFREDLTVSKLVGAAIICVGVIVATKN